MHGGYVTEARAQHRSEREEDGHVAHRRDDADPCGAERLREPSARERADEVADPPDLRPDHHREHHAPCADRLEQHPERSCFRCSEADAEQRHRDEPDRDGARRRGEREPEREQEAAGRERSPRPEPAAQRCARPKRHGAAHVERADLGLAEARSEVERQRPLERAEAERDEHDPRRRERESRGPERCALRAESRRRGRAPEQCDCDRARTGQREVRRERSANPAERPERGTGDAPDRVRGENAGELPVGALGKPLEHAEHDSQPEPARSDPLDEPRGHVHG